MHTEKFCVISKRQQAQAIVVDVEKSELRQKCYRLECDALSNLFYFILCELWTLV